MYLRLITNQFKNVSIRDNSLIKNDEHHVPGEVVNNIHNIHNNFHSPCKEGETTCLGYDAKDRPNKIVCKKGDADC